MPIFLIGHVTKDGAVAGPRVLEHMVDAVLYLEGERYHHYRVLRAAKNRFGSTHELGVFEMSDDGLRRGRESLERLPARSRASRCRAPRWWPASRARARCWSRCRRWSRDPFPEPAARGAAGSIRAASRVLLAVLEKRAGLASPAPTCS